MPVTVDKVADQTLNPVRGSTLRLSTAPGRESSRQDLAQWLKVLAEPNRLKILDLLMQGEQCNCELGDKLGMAPNLISHHLSTLQKAGLVEARRDEGDARWIHYSTDPAALARLTQTFNTVFNPARFGFTGTAAGRCMPQSMQVKAKSIDRGGE